MGFRVLSKPNHSRILGDRCGCLSSPCTPTSPACELTMPPAGASAAASPAWSSSHLIGAQPAPGNPGTAPGHSTANTPGRIQQRNFTFTQKKKKRRKIERNSCNVHIKSVGSGSQLQSVPHAPRAGYFSSFLGGMEGSASPPEELLAVGNVRGSALHSFPNHGTTKRPGL